MLEEFSLYCVDCGDPVVEMVCSGCGRKYDFCGGIPCFLAKEDLQSNKFSKYLQNYDAIAKDDIDEDIMPEFYKVAQAIKLINYCGKKIEGKVLDIGSGKGYFLERVPHQNKLGVDISLDYLNLLNRKRIKGILANAERLPFKSEFDVIVLTDILEHVYSPDLVMRRAYTALKDDGRVVIRVPYKEDISVYDKDKGFKYEFCHLRSFDEQSLKQMVKNAGFTVNRLHYDGFSLNRLRPLFKNRIFKFIFTKKFYQLKDYQVAKFPNWIGRILTRPVELVLIAQKGMSKCL